MEGADAEMDDARANGATLVTGTLHGMRQAAKRRLAEPYARPLASGLGQAAPPFPSGLGARPRS